MKMTSWLAALLTLAVASTEAWATDADGDGHHSIASGGDDCDDGNPDRFPYNAEVCDTVDNDCEPSTIGARDNDEDGVTSAACCNVQYFYVTWNGSAWVPVTV
jgi:hypothetical protein